MANVVPPERFRLQQDLEEAKERDPNLKEQLNKLPIKRQLFIVAQLYHPEKSACEIGRMLGLSRAVSDNAFKSIGGKLKDAFAQLSVTQADVALAIRNGLIATKQIPVVCPVYVDGKKSHSEIQLIEVADHNIRVKTATLVSKLDDYFPAAKVDVRKTSTITHQLPEDTIKRLKLRDKQQTKMLETEHEVVN